MYEELANRACERITRAIVSRHLGEREVKAVLDPYNSTGSTIHVNFTTSKQDPLGNGCAPLSRQLGGVRQRLGSGVLPRRRGT